MRASVKKELFQYGIERLKDLKPSSRELSDSSDIHHQLFNMDYYIIGYYEAEQWLKQHDISVFEGMDFCKEQEEMHFGEFMTNIDNAETLVNHIVYWVGYDLIDGICVHHKMNEWEEADEE